MLRPLILKSALALMAPLMMSACAGVEEGAEAGEVLVVDAGALFDGREVIRDARMVVRDGRIEAVGPQAEVSAPAGADALDYGGRFIMPGMIAAHSHVGTVSGTEHGGRFYSRETVQRDLAQFQRYGVVAVNALGLNRPLFHELRTELRGTGHGGADLFGAGAGVGAVDGAPPTGPMGILPDQAMRPASPEEARLAVQETAQAGVDIIKIWVDPMGGRVPKMPPEIYAAAISEAHAQGLRAAAHIHDLEDAKGVVRAGVDVVGHGVRDAPVDPELISLMLEHDVWYVPTINIDEANYIYAEHPEWLEDAFFAAALSPELEAQLRDEDWRQGALEGAGGSRMAVMNNLRNLQSLHAAGVKVALGTDSGATAVRIPGFAEHRELELMVLAGMTPAEALTAATANGAALMGLTDRGQLAPGFVADFLVLADDPTADIRATRSLAEVWRSGQRMDVDAPGGAP